MMKKYMLSLALISSSAVFAANPANRSDFPEETGCKVFGKEAATILANKFAPRANITYNGVKIVSQGDLVQVVSDAVVNPLITGNLQYIAKQNPKQALVSTAKTAGRVFVQEKLVQIAKAGINKASEVTKIEKPEIIKKDATLNYIVDTFKDYALRYAAALLLKKAEGAYENYRNRNSKSTN